MKAPIWPTLLATLFCAAGGAEARQQNKIIVPDSSVENPGDYGKTAHTHYRMLLPSGTVGNFSTASHVQPNVGTAPFSGYGYQTPASIACIYSLVAQTTGCNPNSVTQAVSGGSKAIALIEAYDYPNAAADLQTFSNQFGLPSANLQVVYANGRQPASDPYGWEMEAALDLQWAHAMAPGATLYLVEAASASLADLLNAVSIANKLVAAAGGGEISMSFGMSEFAGEGSYDSYFNTKNIVYFASSGDAAGTNWPCVSQKVVCVGGTTLRYSHTGDTFLQEVPWVDAGGGHSSHIGKPSYQSALAPTSRGVPDIALAADPNTGAWIHYSPSNYQPAGWWIVGGTSWAAPMAAGITNSAGKFNASSTAELTQLYSSAATTYLKDIHTGWCGPTVGYSATVGWDQCTGLGSLVGLY